MATSPIYNWPEPDNTDLVKNGALAIRTLGNAIDTTMATMVPKTIVDAKGDLIAGTAADTAARLAVGNNGETLVADSSTSTGLRYTSATGQNPVLNSAFQVWQRGTSFTPNASTYVADRWGAYNGVTGRTITRQLTGDTTNLPSIQYCLRSARDSGNTSTAVGYLFQPFETINSIPFAGKTVTYSFYARKGANFSGSVSAELYTGTGTDQNPLASYTGYVSVIAQTPTLTTTWQRFTYTGTLGATANEMSVAFNWTPSGTAGAADYFEVTGVQVDIGSVALPFRTNAATFQGELAACQRYYVRWGGDAIYQRIGAGFWSQTTNLATMLINPVPLRTGASAVDYSTITSFDGVSFYSISAVTIDSASKLITQLNVTTATNTQYRNGQVLTNNSTSGYLGLSAEL